MAIGYLTCTLLSSSLQLDYHARGLDRDTLYTLAHIIYYIISCTSPIHITPRKILGPSDRKSIQHALS